MSTVTSRSTAEVLRIVAEAQFKPLTPCDRIVFKDVADSEAMIGTHGDCTVIVSGEVVSLIEEDGCVVHYQMGFIGAELMVMAKAD